MKVWRIIGCFGLVLVQLSTLGQSFSAEVNQTKIGLNDRLEYTMVLKDIAKGSYTPPDFSQGFYVLSGPNQSSQTSIINGKKESVIRISYILRPRQVGKIKIAEASIQMGDETLRSATFEIEVEQQTPEEIAAQKSTEKDLYIDAEVSKRNVYVGEPITVRYKLYAAVDIGRRNEALNNPDFTGFWSQQLESDNNWKREYVNGREYQTVIISEFLLIPQSVGKQQIEPMKWRFAVQKRRQQNPRDPFGGFFQRYEEVPVEVASKAVSVNIKALPKKGQPSNFSGAVGDFSLSVTQNKSSVKANEGIDIKVRLSGRGNLELAEIPRPDFPPDFDVYDPKTINRVNASIKGMSGYKELQYLVIPRYKGEYSIPGMDFSYFNPRTEAYESITGSDHQISVTEGESGDDLQVFTGRAKTDLEVKNRDIRFIKSESSLTKGKHHFTGSLLQILLFFSGPFIVLIAFVFRKKQMALSKMPLSMQPDKVRKLARKQLKSAESALKNNNKEGYYQQLYDAVNAYLSRKLDIEISLLNRQRIHEAMHARNYPENVQEQVNKILDTCEMARFAPATKNMESLHEEALSLIEQMESTKS